MDGGSGFNVFAGPELIRAALVVIFALVLGGLRVLGHKSQSFQAVAHLFVGALFGVFYYSWRDGVPDFGVLWVAVALSVLELCAFIVGRALRPRTANP